MVSSSKIRGRIPLRDTEGTSLVEVLIAMLVVGIVLTAVTSAFVSATRTQADQIGRLDAQETARIALDRMRRDIHCAGGTATVTANGLGGTTLALTVSPTACPRVTTLTNGVHWCTVSVSASRYRLYRETSGNCDGAGATFSADFVTQSSLWTVPACPTGRLRRIAVQIPVNGDPVRRAERTYTLREIVVLRNSTVC